MSNQTGGDGYGKFKKSCQRGGASGWAKHCGNTDDHKMSNRAERKKRGEFDDERPRGAGKKKSDKKPTRRHLLDKLRHLDAKISERRKYIDAHKKKAGKDCKCYMFCSDRWIDEWYAKDRVKILKEFTKHGYKAE